MTDPNPPRRRLAWIAFGAAVLVGAAIRLDQIARQIPGDDEWHSLRALLTQTYGWIATHFGLSDHSIPLTLYEKLLADTIGLSELGMRAPSLLAGLASLVAIPLLLRPAIGLKASVILAWLLAISPLHVYYSRYARPYAPALLLTVVAVIAFDRWRRERGAGWAVLFVVAATLGPWFHPIFLPFTLAPLAWVAARRIFGKEGAESAPGAVWPLLLGCAIGLAALLGPPIWSDFQGLSSRSEGAGAGLASPDEVFELMSGANRPFLAFGFGLAVLLGLVAMRRRWSGVMGCLVFAGACQAGAILAVGPAEIRTPITTARYLLPAFVVLLAVAALGLEHLDALLRKEWRWIPPHAFTVVLGVSLLAFGPLPAIHYRPNDFTNHTVFQYDYAPNFPHNFASKNFGLKKIPEFYLRLHDEPAGGRSIVEAPWYYEWHRQPFALYQRVHRWPVLVGFIARPGEPLPLGELPMTDPRFRMRSFVHVSDLDGMRERNVRYVVFHRNPPRQPDDDMHPSLAGTEAWISEYRELVGEPCYTDEDLCVFDLGLPMQPR
ncbi:MAG: hypothetical protein ACKVXR_01960 [Planctomycetota bacterium]